MSHSVRKRRSLVPRMSFGGRPHILTNVYVVDENQRREREQAVRKRRQKRRLEELQRTNYRDAPSGGSGNTEASATLAGIIAARREDEQVGLPINTNTTTTTTTNNTTMDEKKRGNAEIKRILSTRKGFHVLLEEAIDAGKMETPPNYLSATSKPFRYPAKPMCSICGYWSKVTCIRCGDGYCGLSCSKTHDETRCERPIR